jgi:hypothetical protein
MVAAGCAARVDGGWEPPGWVHAWLCVVPGGWAGGACGVCLLLDAGSCVAAACHCHVISCCVPQVCMSTHGRSCVGDGGCVGWWPGRITSVLTVPAAALARCCHCCAVTALHVCCLLSAALTCVPLLQLYFCLCLVCWNAQSVPQGRWCVPANVSGVVPCPGSKPRGRFPEGHPAAPGSS